MTAEYGVSERYTYDPQQIGLGTNSTIRYTTEYNRDDEHATVSVQGNVRGGIYATIEQVRQGFSSLNIHDIASGMYFDVDGSGTLYNRAISANITENVSESDVSFSYEYTDDPDIEQEVVFKDRVTVEENCIDQTACITLDGRFEGNIRGCHETLWVCPTTSASPMLNIGNRHPPPITRLPMVM